jgi:hypothetical protein
MEGQLGAWPTEVQCRNWSNLDAYCEDSPIADFVRTCRKWARAVMATDAELLATAYAYALRQAKYGNPPSLPLAVALADGAYEALKAGTR